MIILATLMPADPAPEAAEKVRFKDWFLD